MIKNTILNEISSFCIQWMLNILFFLFNTYRYFKLILIVSYYFAIQYSYIEK